MLNESTPYDIEEKVENFHWWFFTRRKLLRFLLSSIPSPEGSVRIDLGCGVGSNLKVLETFTNHVVGLDHSIYALSLVHKKVKIPLINGDINHLPLKPKSVGLIIAMDVLEHLEDDENAMREFCRALRKGGILILTVPAFQSLRGVQDIVTGHKRRYSRKEITNKLRKAGFNILKSSYFNFFLFFPILIARRVIYLFGLKIESENEVNFPLINFFLKAVFSLEVYALKYLSFPFGVSILCVAKK
jgi:SAM-dependent methyltransferase